MARYRFAGTQCAPVLVLVLAAPSAHALDTTVSGRVMFGTVVRTEASDPVLLTAINAPAIGLKGLGSGGNADDANLNYRRGDDASRALHGYLDLAAREGGFAALARVVAWRDVGLLHDARPWGNVPSDYAAGQPLGDRGAPALSRFSGAALGDAWVQQRFHAGSLQFLGRVGQQSLDWGARSGMAGGLEALNPKNLPALHRAGAAPQEARIPMPMLFGRVDLNPALAIEGFYQTRFRPSALDMCGTLWSMSDYLVDGCDKVMSGQPVVNDRTRVALGAYQKRLPTPRPDSSEFGIGLTWKSAALATDFGFYHARYTSRTPMPGLRKTTRANGPALVAGDPDGKNMAYFTEYPEGITMSAVTFAHKHGRTSVSGELSYRPNLPFMLAPGDVVPPFLNPNAPSLLRADVNAVPPGGLFHGYDSYGVTQGQLGVQHEWSAGGVALSAGAEAVVKHTSALPDQAVRRYNRTDIYGAGVINGVCNVATGNAERQCSLRGYVTTDAYAYRLRLDARFGAVLPGLDAATSVVFTHDVKGWSGDFLVNEGRKSASLALRLEYRKRYLAELAWLPVWGGDYYAAADRDTASLAVGVRF